MSDSSVTETGARRERKAAEPMGAEDFEQLLSGAHQLVTAAERALQSVSPKLTLGDYLALRGLETSGKDGSAPKVRGRAAKSLVKNRYVEQQGEMEGGAWSMTTEGQRVLGEADKIVAGMLDTANQSGKNLRANAGRTMQRAAKSVLKARRDERAGKDAAADDSGMEA